MITLPIVSIGRDCEEVDLFDTKSGRIKLYKSLTLDQQTKILAKYEGKDDAESKAMIAAETIVACFIEWNVGKDDVAFPCTVDVLKQFSQRDLLAMLQVCTGHQLLDTKGNILTADEAAKKAVSA